MATSTPFFPVDPTGEAKANRRLLEPHLLADTGTNYVRAVSLDMGAFFVKSVKVYDKASGVELRPEIDYLFTEYYSSLSVIFKQDIAGTLIITNPLVNPEITVSYNFVGTAYGNTIKNIAKTINAEASRREISNLQWDMLNKCRPILPSDYVRQIGSGIGFETIVFALERIRSTIMYGDFDTELTIGQFIDNFLMTVEAALDARVKNEFKKELEEFRDSFTKELLGLDKVVNMAPVDPELARLAVVRSFIFDKNKDGYVTIKAISRFKEELYNNLVSKNKTSIGRYQGTYGLPLLTTIYALRNGDGFIIDSLNASKVAGYDFNEVVYPDRASPEDKWAITKVTNNVQGNGGVLWGTNMTTGELYIGHLKNGIDEPEVLTWTKLYSEFDMERALDALTKHINDIENPHWVNKHQILLGDVENYPTADADDLACRVPSKKYVTLKWVLAFLSTYMNGLKTAEDLKNMNCDENEVIRNIKLIFAPCGPCGPCCEPNIVPVTTTTSKPPVIVDPEGQLTGWFCESGKRWDIMTDGKGGTKTVEHKYKENDPDIEKDGCVITTTTTTTTTTSTTTTTTTTTTTKAPATEEVLFLDEMQAPDGTPLLNRKPAVGVRWDEQPRDQWDTNKPTVFKGGWIHYTETSMVDMMIPTKFPSKTELLTDNRTLAVSITINIPTDGPDPEDWFAVYLGSRDNRGPAKPTELVRFNFKDNVFFDPLIPGTRLNSGTANYKSDINFTIFVNAEDGRTIMHCENRPIGELVMSPFDFNYDETRLDMFGIRTVLFGGSNPNIVKNQLYVKRVKIYTFAKP